MKIDDIAIGNRARQDMGNIEALADSIKENGLLQPIAVDADNFLVDGQRRILAVQMLGWTEIPAHVVDPAELLRAEFDANEIRKSFTPSEKVALAERIRYWIETKAKERQEIGRKEGGRGHKKLAEDSAPSFKTREVVARAVGTSHDTLNKASQVVKAAEANPENADLVDQMDKTGNVSGAYNELEKRIAEEKESIIPVVLIDGKEKELYHLASATYKYGSVLAWIAGQVQLADGMDILISRKGNKVCVYTHHDLDLPPDVRLVSEGIGQVRNESFMKAIRGIEHGPQRGDRVSDS